MDTPVGEVADPDPVLVAPDDSVTEAVVALLDREADYLLVTDRGGAVRGVVCPLDVVVATGTAGTGLQEQLRRAPDADTLATTGRRLPALLAELVRGGLGSARVLAVYSALVDACLRRAIELVLAGHPELPPDGFTWLSIGSNGRREAVLSSDVDSAVSFDDDLSPETVQGYRRAFAEVHALLARAGLGHDQHGAAAYRPEFSRTKSEWRAAAQGWLDNPIVNQGAMMTSLLVDARPVWGDTGLPAVARVFNDLRAHPLTMQLLLKESLAYRARMRSVRDLLARRPETFDIKAHALLPITNIARWGALSAGTAVLPTPERLRESGTSEMLPGRPGPDHGRRVRGAAGGPPGGPARPGRPRRARLRRPAPGAPVAPGPQRHRLGRPRDRRRPAPHGQPRRLAPHRGVGRLLSPSAAEFHVNVKDPC